MTFLPHGELVAQAWLRGISGLPTNGIGTTLPSDNSTWSASGFVQIESAGGVPALDVPVYRPLITVRCWANRSGSARPDWGKANQLAEIVKISGYGTVDSVGPAARIVQLAPNFQNARVMAAYATTEPRRVNSDEARFAQYSLEMQFVYAPTILPATIGPDPILDPSDPDVNFVYHQNSPLSTWIITHSLGREVQVTVWDDTGEVVYPEIDNPNLNQTVVSFAAPATGTVIIG
jgi:proteasome lid subunit RPN8/RPN11